MRTAHIGNLAGNAYNIAKFLRQYTDIEADSFDYGDALNWTPRWEEGDFDWTYLPNLAWDSQRIAHHNGWQRSPWAKILGHNHGPAWFETEEEYAVWRRLLGERAGRLCWPVFALTGRYTHAEWPLLEIQQQLEARVPAAESLRRLWPPPEVAGNVASRGQFLQDLQVLPRWQAVRGLAQSGRYDLLVLYGPEAANGVALSPDCPYVTFEHATMRPVPSGNTPEHRLLVHAYRRARHNIVTNADCRRAAEHLGLTNYSFIPHPVDTEGKFTPAPSARAAWLRARILDHEQAEVLILAPARHSDAAEIGVKGNAVLLRAYQRYVQVAEPQGAPRAVLLLAAWGNAVEASQRLVHELGLAARVLWHPMLPKLHLAELYRAADIVCDQFVPEYGAFGTVTVEAMACARPLITYIDVEAHRWCLPEPPPVCNAATLAEVYTRLLDLAHDPALRQRQGQIGRAWVDAHHSSRLVAEQHAALYRRVVGEVG